MKSKGALLWLLVGIFGRTQIQVGGSIGIAELVMFLIAPIIFFQDLNILKKDGFLTAIWLALLACVGCIAASMYNQSPMPLFLRGLATTYSLFALPVVFHRMMRKNLEGVIYFFIGDVISAMITIYAFKSGMALSSIERNGEGADMESALFFMEHFGCYFTLLIYSWYLKVPTWLSATLVISPGVYTMLTTATGRSAVMMTLVSFFLLIYVHRSWERMRVLKKRFVMLVAVGAIAVSGFGTAYKFLASTGRLNEKAQEKYEKQSQKGSGLLATIMSGRSEFFVGLIASFDQPIFGHGPWPVDKNGYYLRFLEKYGNDEDIQMYLEKQRWNMKIGRGIHVIPVHSMIVGNWVYYGILGLPYWIYILYKFVVLMRKHIDAVPQWFGYFAFNIPNMIWAIMFSPFGGRTGIGCMLAMVFMAIAVGEGRVRLPDRMIREALKVDGRRKMKME